VVGAELVRACLDQLALPQETELERPRVSAFAVLVGVVRGGHGLTADYKTRATRVSWVGAWGPGHKVTLGLPCPRPGQVQARTRGSLTA
jgi:hypothetical protein